MKKRIFGGSLLTLCFLALALLRTGDTLWYHHQAAHAQVTTVTVRPAVGIPTKAEYSAWWHAHRAFHRDGYCYVITIEGQPLCDGAFQIEATDAELHDWRLFLAQRSSNEQPA
jgi:hypothetical protein